MLSCRSLLQLFSVGLATPRKSVSQKFEQEVEQKSWNENNLREENKTKFPFHCKEKACS